MRLVYRCLLKAQNCVSHLTDAQYMFLGKREGRREVRMKEERGRKEGCLNGWKDGWIMIINKD